MGSRPAHMFTVPKVIIMHCQNLVGKCVCRSLHSQLVVPNELPVAQGKAGGNLQM